MKKHLVRFFTLILACGALAFSTGCAEFAEGLAGVAAGMQQSQQQNGYGSDYDHTARNTSAPGIK
ncbi:MAG: hypothetical protein C0518_15735 [Opitutus sp.]|nr:hypothetical protein [Opitutus sp.]